MTNLRRITILAGAFSLLVGISSLVSTATTPVSHSAGLYRIAAALGFAVAGLGLLAQTRQKDRGRLLAQSASATLGLLAITGLAMVGLHAVSVRPYLALPASKSAATLFGSELDLLTLMGFLAIAVALFALTLNGRKRAGASFTASLAVTVGMMGGGTLVASAVGLPLNDTGLFDVLLATTLFPIVGLGLFCAAKKELECLSSTRSSPLRDHHVSAATGVCLGLVALCAFLLFRLTGHEGDQSHRLNEIGRFRAELVATTVSLRTLDEHVNYSLQSPPPSPVPLLSPAIKKVEASLNRLSSFASWPVYQQHLSTSVARENSEVVRLRDIAVPPGRNLVREAVQALSVYQLSNASAELVHSISLTTSALQQEIDEYASLHVQRRRGTAIVLAGSAAVMALLLGAIHLLFQSDSVSRQRSEVALRRHNETLKGFAHTVAHDLRAPLRGIAGYASELESQAHLVDTRGRHCIAQINTAAQNLERLIGDTLDYAQLDAETPSLSTIALPALVASLLQQRAPEIRQYGTQIDTHFGIVTVRSWERGIVQIVGNLLDNAIKYSRNAQPPRLRIETAQTPLSWRLAIYDNGIGFDMRYHDRIFGLFQRLVTTDEFEGTGAGLAIVRKITDRLGGTVRAEGRPGGGATFLVELPRIVNPELT